MTARFDGFPRLAGCDEPPKHVRCVACGRWTAATDRLPFRGGVAHAVCAMRASLPVTRALIAERSTPEPNSGCWLWDEHWNPAGYGMMWTNGRLVLAHRLSWELHNGPIPGGMCILHRCDTPACVNPDHLRLGTRAENRADCVTKGRQRAGRGERNRGAKVTAETVQAIRAALDLCESQASIGRRFGLTQASISRIRHGVTWGWLPAPTASGKDNKGDER